MGLIKSANAPSTIAAFSIKDIETQAKAHAHCARQQADQLLAAAQSEAQEMKVSARPMDWPKANAKEWPKVWKPAKNPANKQPSPSITHSFSRR